MLLGEVRELLVDHFLVGFGAQRRLSVHTILFSESGGLGGFGYDDRDAAASEGVTIDQALGDFSTEAEDVLNLLGSDVLTLRKLEDILGSINNLDGTVGVDHSDVTGLEPSILVEGLLRLVGSLVVTRGD